jgi:4'-phosphopantetheinyl transferase
MKEKILYTEIEDKPCEENFYNLLTLVSKDRQDRIKAYHYDIDKKLSLYSALIVRKNIIDLFHITNDKIDFEINEYGKPNLKNHPDFHFSLSHTRNAIIVGFSSNPIGVDVEGIKEVNIGIAGRFFTTDEQKYILSCKKREKGFYEIWTKKEAYIKCLGKGLSIPLKSFNVCDQRMASSFYTEQCNEYVVSVYGLNDVASCSITKLNIDEFLSKEIIS